MMPRFRLTSLISLLKMLSKPEVDFSAMKFHKGQHELAAKQPDHSVQGRLLSLDHGSRPEEQQSGPDKE